MRHKFLATISILLLSSMAAFAVDGTVTYTEPQDYGQTIQKTIYKDSLIINNFDAENTYKSLIKVSNSNNQETIKNCFYQDKEIASALKEAKERFEQSNVTVSYNTYDKLIDSGKLNDFYYVYLAYKMANIGFFSLAEKSIKNIDNKNLWQDYTEELKKYYMPKSKLSYEEEMFLANIYTSIYYNNLTRESIFDLMKKDKIMRRSDYAEYLAASAFYIEKDYTKALGMINRACSQNSDNVYYMKYKARILTELEKYNDALNIIENIENKKLKMVDTDNTANTRGLKYLILSKNEKNEFKSKLYLAKYFYINNAQDRALKELSGVQYKSKMPEISTLMGDIYFYQKDYKKAQNAYNVALMFNKRCSSAFKGLGDINLAQNTFATAKEYYEKAYHYNKQDEDTLLNLAIASFAQNDIKNARKYADIALSVSSKDNYKIYYVQAKLKPERSAQYLDKALQINPLYADTWFDLGDIALAKSDINTAEKYISNGNFLAQGSYKYYYYISKIDDKLNKKQEAEQNMQEAVNMYAKDNPQKEISEVK